MDKLFIEAVTSMSNEELVNHYTDRVREYAVKLYTCCDITDFHNVLWLYRTELLQRLNKNYSPGRK